MHCTTRIPCRTFLSASIQAAISSLLLVSLANAATCTVNSNTDDPVDASAKVTAVPPGPWSGANASTVTLRDCIVAADLMTGSTGVPTSPGMTIDASGIAGQTVTLGDALPLIFNNTTIDGGAGAAVTLDGANAHRIFFVSGLPILPATPLPPADPDGAQAVAVMLNKLILQHGLAKGGDTTGGGGGMGAGGALFVNQLASVVLNNVSFTANAATGGTGGRGTGGGGGMGPGTSRRGGGGLGAPSTGDGGAGIGTGGVYASGQSGGFGGQGLGQISSAQGFNSLFFDVDGGTGASGKGLIGGGGNYVGSLHQGGFGSGGGAGNASSDLGGFGGGGGAVVMGAQKTARHSSGGFGGGGGSGQTVQGGNGGFGGGGGGGYYAGAGYTGAYGYGGVGGGGGCTPGCPSYYASGGGGAGFGGGVFVRAGGSLLFQGNSVAGISGGAVTLGAGGEPGRNDGAAVGSGLFLMSGATTTFDILGGYTIADAIADDSVASVPAGHTYRQGNGSGAALTKSGVGTLNLSAISTYSGTTTVSAGVLRVGSPGSISASATVVDADGTLTGDGAVHSVDSSGTGAPGTSINPTGTLTVNATLTLHPSALTCFHLDGASNATSHFNVGDTASLGGVARLDFAATPVAGTTYTVIHAASISGVFSRFETNSPNLSGNFNYGATDVTFTVTVGDSVFRDGFESSGSGSLCAAAFTN